MHASISDIIKQNIISKTGDVFISYFVLTGNSIWRPIRTKALSDGMSVVEEFPIKLWMDFCGKH